jgi:chemotaxis protein methyltransferase CheR
MDAALTEIAELVRRESGITMTASQEVALRAALARAAPGVDAGEFVRLNADPADKRQLVARLIDEVTIKETTFLRDRQQLDMIDWRGLFQRARRNGSQRLRVWSAGCATGEEAYTLALLASQAFSPADPPLDVLGTDISSSALAAAAAGRYRQRAVRELDDAQRSRFFRVEDGEHVVDGFLRRFVRFDRHNLVRDPMPPLGERPFDLIVCRNVLIYFDVSTVERILGAFERALSSGGTLLIGAADALCGTAGRLSRALSPARRAAAAPVRVLRHARAHGHETKRDTKREDKREGEREGRLKTALAAADVGNRDDAITHASALLAENPLDADAYFVRGLVQLEQELLDDAVASLRRALYVDPSFALAAFTLGRAYDAVGDDDSARRAYGQALRTIAPEDDRHEVLLQQVDLNDIAAACRARLAATR